MKYSSKNATFQFGLLLLMTFGLSMGIILTTGKASLIFSPSAQVTDYSTKPAVPTSNPVLPSPPLKPRVPTTPPKTNPEPGDGFYKCILDGNKCKKGRVCCGFCNEGKCQSLGQPRCTAQGGWCGFRQDPCCDGTTCSGRYLGKCEF